MDNTYHAGQSIEPLPGGKTRIKTYADGGALLSDETVSTEEALKRIAPASSVALNWEHPETSTYRLEKQSRDGRYGFWRYGSGGWQYVKSETVTRVTGMTYLGEDDKHTYWR